MVHRIYVEKKQEFAVEAKGILHEIRHMLRIKSVVGVRIINRYDVEGISEQLFKDCIDTVFSEPALDDVYNTLEDAINAKSISEKHSTFATEYLPGQFDLRAASAAQCIQLISQQQLPSVLSARVFLIYGNVLKGELEQIINYTINPVEARQAELDVRQTLNVEYEIPTTVETLHGFIDMTDEQLYKFAQNYGLAMDEGDIVFCKNYFKSENRNPTITEIKMIDTYWSDHCRHTTFGTVLTDVKIDDETIKNSYERYLKLRSEVHKGKLEHKPICLMDMGTIGAKYLKQNGILKNLDESDEINACSVEIKVDVNGKDEDWLLLFKNETHNHPTEIEPFGGAATCIGGAIRDPLANRGYVYQAMRVTGAGNPLVSVKNTTPGKLSQRKLVQTAAAGYSSYGNQIGLATGMVDEIYHKSYIAKRMEIGAVVGAVPKSAVRRQEPAEGDVVILLGGKTGRDGCGGATGSSKAHSSESLAQCGAEVQKGNAPEERKLQRLFRNKDATLLIKRCNDFGAGGVSVAIGELADGLIIELDKVPKKYDGLDGTELAISESQERMAVVVEAKDAEKFMQIANSENLQATQVATITNENRLVMMWCGKKICDIDRNFLNSNGANKYMSAHVTNMQNIDLSKDTLTDYGDVYDNVVAGEETVNYVNANSKNTLEENLTSLMGNLNVCSKKGLAERFDSTIGSGTVLMPFGGKNQLTQTQAMVAKLPVLNATTQTCSAMAWGYNPNIAIKNTYVGAYIAVLESISKIVATGFNIKNTYLTFQEYFERLKADPTRWGKPVGALLGALDAQLDFGVGAIGGKDSMSGSFEQLDVAPTLVSFAVSHGDVEDVISPEFKAANSEVVFVMPSQVNKNGNNLPNVKSQLDVFDIVYNLIQSKKIISAFTPTAGGVAEGLVKMCMGNKIGFSASSTTQFNNIFSSCYGGFILELANGFTFEDFSNFTKNKNDDVICKLLGNTSAEYTFIAFEQCVNLADIQKTYEQKLGAVLPYLDNHMLQDDKDSEFSTAIYNIQSSKFDTPKYTGPAISNGKIAKPRVLIPVFPGTNCEYDSAAAMQNAGAISDIFVINNLTQNDVEESVKQIVKRIENSQIIFLPGGFSGGDEPEGSAKLIAAFLRNPQITNAVHELLYKRDGLMIGICNGFQALIKLGLLPFGKIVKTNETSPTLTFNKIGRHQSMLVHTKIVNNSSPWLAQTSIGDVHTVAISHGEGRFVANSTALNTLIKNGQVATQYVDKNGDATMNLRYNPNGSILAIEGITSPDGRILGKMGHSERFGKHLYKNVCGNKIQPIFTAGVNYFK